MWCGNGVVRPLALSLDAEMVAHLAEGDLRLPALHEPANELQGIASRVGAEQGLRVEAVLGIAQQHPPDRQDQQAGVAPNGGGGTDLDHALPLAVPGGHDHPLPARAPIHQHVGEPRQACTLGAWASNRPGPAWRRWLVQGRVEPQARDAGQVLAGKSHQELQGGEAAVAPQHDLAARQPATCLQPQLPCPVRQLFVPPAMLAAVARRKCQRGQEGQRPDASRPGDRGEQHQAQPTQAAGLDEVALRRPDRVAIDALGADPLAAATLDRVVDARHHKTARYQDGDQEAEQQASRRTGIPGGPIEHALIVGEPPFPAEPRDPQETGHGTCPGARMAPISSNSAWRHVRCCRNTGVKVRMTAAKRAGRCMATSLAGDVPTYRRPASPPCRRSAT